MDMTSLSNFFEVGLFFFSILVTGPNFMSLLSVVLELSQFPFTRDLPEFQKLEIPRLRFAQYLETEEI